jgi:hypothetical protein
LAAPRSKLLCSMVDNLGWLWYRLQRRISLAALYEHSDGGP